MKASLTLFVVWVTLVLVLSLYVFLLFIGQAPRHCRYLVPVKTKPGIYSCSEYPHPMVKP